MSNETQPQPDEQSVSWWAELRDLELLESASEVIEETFVALVQEERQDVKAKLDAFMHAAHESMPLSAREAMRGVQNIPGTYRTLTFLREMPDDRNLRFGQQAVRLGYLLAGVDYETTVPHVDQHFSETRQDHKWQELAKQSGAVFKEAEINYHLESYLRQTTTNISDENLMKKVACFTVLQIRAWQAEQQRQAERDEAVAHFHTLLDQTGVYAAFAFDPNGVVAEAITNERVAHGAASTDDEAELPVVAAELWEEYDYYSQEAARPELIPGRESADKEAVVSPEVVERFMGLRGKPDETLEIIPEPGFTYEPAAKATLEAAIRQIGLADRDFLPGELASSNSAMMVRCVNGYSNLRLTRLGHIARRWAFMWADLPYEAHATEVWGAYMSKTPPLQWGGAAAQAVEVFESRPEHAALRKSINLCLSTLCETDEKERALMHKIICLTFQQIQAWDQRRANEKSVAEFLCTVEQQGVDAFINSEGTAAPE